jgi:flagellar FliL protein
MAATTAEAPEKDVAALPAPPARGGRRWLVFAVPPVVGVMVAGLWFGGVLPPLLGMGKKAHSATAHPADQPTETIAKQPSFVELPEMIANLNAGRRNSFVKLHAKLELARAEDAAAVNAGMPRLLDLFQTYLREMHPEELHGSVGIWRLREELIARANVAVAPARVVDVLFTEMLIQ